MYLQQARDFRYCLLWNCGSSLVQLMQDCEAQKEGRLLENDICLLILIVTQADQDNVTLQDAGRCSNELLHKKGEHFAGHRQAIKAASHGRSLTVLTHTFLRIFPRI